ncbi:hypothetical protein V6N13_060408 [Hibiscus sabdariffa]|uniref:Uncharacterized protein n=1 Tax=Hibiscus sabdariffa TaxID=183260 RepID=A0ABR2GA51_9ROSI
MQRLLLTHHSGRELKYKPRFTLYNRNTGGDAAQSSGACFKGCDTLMGSGSRRDMAAENQTCDLYKHVEDLERCRA